MKQIAQVVTIPAASTNAQIEAALNTAINNGWELISVFQFGARTIAILKKVVAN